MSQTHPLTTTTFELPGYRLTRSFGVVRGIIVRSRSIVGNIGASIQSLFGGNISLYTSLCERARDDAFRQMLAHAAELGANAVIGVRYDATEISPGITEVLCYGTAVFVEVAAGGPRRLGNCQSFAKHPRTESLWPDIVNGRKLSTLKAPLTPSAAGSSPSSPRR